MRVYSTPESVEAGEFTLLAIAETIAVTSIVVYLAVWRGSLFFIALTATVAPFLLLKTNDSQARGLRWMKSVLSLTDRFYFSKFVEPIVNFLDRKVNTDKSIKHFLNAPFIRTLISSSLIMFIWLMFLIIALATSILIRFSATLTSLCLDTTNSMLAIPQNWQRICLSMDLAHPPELLPGIDEIDVQAIRESELGEFMEIIKFKQFVNHYFYTAFDADDRLTYVILLLRYSFTLIIYVPSIVYRWSLKSTSLVYLPLMWAVRSNLTSANSAADKTGDILQDGIERLSRWYAWFVIVFLTALPMAFLFYAYSARMRFSDRIDFFISSTISPVLSYQILKIFLFVTPDRIEIGSWHLTRFAGAVITVWLYNYTQKSKRKIDKGIWSESDVERRIGVAAFSRSCLAIWTTVCSVAIVLTSVRWYMLPEVVIRWFPWITPR
jgi:hypothetical protein